MNIIHYHYHNGSSQQGPFTLEQILKQPIKMDTPIWKEGETVWQDASKFPEFSSLFSSSQRQSPPPFIPKPVIEERKAQDYSIKNSNATKKSGYGRILRILAIFVLIVVGIIVFINNFFLRSGAGSSDSGENNDRSSYEERKLSILEIEQANPSQFLFADGIYNRTLFGKKIKVQGTVTNKATVANFKDIEIEVVYYSSTKSEIQRERFILYDYVPANSTKSFEWKIKPPSGTNTVGWLAVSAKSY